MVIKCRGFKLGHKLARVIEWTIQRRKKTINTIRLNPQSCMSKLRNWARSLKLRAIRHCVPKSRSGYIRLGQDTIEDEAVTGSVPKGYLAVYVGEEEDNTKRYVVPVIYFNHPLFWNLLKETEEEYGFDHSGGIQIPCRVSEFENIRRRIAAAGYGGC